MRGHVSSGFGWRDVIWRESRAGAGVRQRRFRNAHVWRRAGEELRRRASYGSWRASCPSGRLSPKTGIWQMITARGGGQAPALRRFLGMHGCGALCLAATRRSVAGLRCGYACENASRRPARCRYSRQMNFHGCRLRSFSISLRSMNSSLSISNPPIVPRPVRAFFVTSCTSSIAPSTRFRTLMTF